LSSIMSLSLSTSFSLTRRPPTPPLFPYTTLFRSLHRRRAGVRARHRLGGRARLPRPEVPRHPEHGRRREPRVRAPRRRPCSGCRDRKSTRLNSSHSQISYAVFCLKKKKKHCSAVPAALELAVMKRQPSALCPGEGRCRPVAPEHPLRAGLLPEFACAFRLVIGGVA